MSNIPLIPGLGRPLISCICVTHKKPHLLEKAIMCFSWQTYENKQLVILYEDGDLATKRFIMQSKFPENFKILSVPSSPKQSLGQLRNCAISKADGEYVCQWDDDDWYNAERLTIQFEAIINSGLKGSILNQWLLFNNQDKKAYLSNIRLWEGSILCRKANLITKQYDNKAQGEDTPVIEYLYVNNLLMSLSNMASLYIYIFHGSNTWHFSHFQNIFNHSVELSSHSKVIHDIIELKHSSNMSSLLLKEICQEYKQ